MSEIPNNASPIRKPRSRAGRKVRETYEKRLIYNAQKNARLARIKSEEDSLKKILDPNSQIPVSQDIPPQSCQTSTFEPTIPDTDLGHHELTNLKEFQDIFEASIKRAEALVQLS